MSAFSVIGAIAALALGLFAAGCSGDDSGGDSLLPDATTNSSAEAVPTSPPQDSASAGVATPTEAIPDSPRLQKALLELDDMPSGWSISDDNDESDDSGGFCGAGPSSRSAKATGKAERGFQQSAFGPMFGQILVSYSGNDAKKVMTEITKTIKDCAEWNDIGDDGTTTTWKGQPLSFTRLGDESIALRVSTDQVPMFGVAQVDVVYVRRANTVAAYYFLAIGPGAAARSNSLEPLAKKADVKLQVALR